MKKILIFIFSICVGNMSFAQKIDIRYCVAAKYVMQSINLYDQFKSNYPNRSRKKKKINYTGFVVSSEVYYIDTRFFMKKTNDTIAQLLSKQHYFKTYKIPYLSNLSSNNASLLYLYFSEPIGNLLVAEIVYNTALASKKYFMTKLNITGDNFPLITNYHKNQIMSEGLRVLFIFNDNNEIIEHIEAFVTYD